MFRAPLLPAFIPKKNMYPSDMISLSLLRKLGVFFVRVRPISDLLFLKQHYYSLMCVQNKT
jgi:hypothetical protein